MFPRREGFQLLNGNEGTQMLTCLNGDFEPLQGFADMPSGEGRNLVKRSSQRQPSSCMWT